MKHNTGIYQIINKINGKRYIGSAVKLNDRESQHFSYLRKNKHHSKYLQRSYDKHGKEAFEFQVLLYCDKKSLIFYEQRAIDAYDFDKELYNLSPTAGNTLGVKHTVKSRMNMSNAHKNPSKETRAKIGNASRGRIVSKETRKKMSESLTGRTFTEEARKKMSIAQKGAKNNMFGKTGELNPFYGKKHSKESLRKMSIALSGEKNPNYGKEKTDEVKKKISESNKGKTFSVETRSKISKSKTIQFSPEQIEKMKEMRKNGKSYRFISNEFKTSQTPIKRVLKASIF